MLNFLNELFISFFLFIFFSFPMAWLFMHAWNYAITDAITVTNNIDFWHAYVMMIFIGVFAKQNIVSKN